MIRWVIVAAVIGLVGCKGSPKPSCDPANPSNDWAYAEYLAQGGTRVEHLHGLHVFARDAYPGLFDFVHVAGPHQETAFLGTVWKCKLHRDRRALAKVLLLEEGWSAANAPMRHTLATKVAGELVARPLEAADKNWDPVKEFTPPQVSTMPDTGVKLVHWQAHFVNEQYRDGSATPAYTQWEIVITPDGTVGEPKKLASYQRDKPVN